MSRPNSLRRFLLRYGSTKPRLQLAALSFLLTRTALLVSALRPAALVTGSTDGIGVTTAKHLAATHGLDVLIHGRDQARIQAAARTVHAFVEQNNGSGRVFTLPPIDISTVDNSVRLTLETQQLCREEDLHLCVLMNNAGVFSEQLEHTRDGLESTFAVNVLAPFVITSMLLPTLLQYPSKTGSCSRIVLASSISQCQSIRNWDDLTQYNTRSFSAHGTYSDSKLLDAMLTMELAERLQDAGIGTDQITCNCLDPGTVNTKMLLAGWGRCGIDIEDALDQTWLLTSKEVENVTGKYFVWRSERRAGTSAYNPVDRARLWAILSELAPEASAMWKFDWRP